MTETDPETQLAPRLWFSVSEEDYILEENEQECYIETDKPLTPEHQQLFNDLYQYVQSLLSRDEPWTYKPDESSTDETPVPDSYIEYLRIYAHKRTICRHLKGSDYDMDRAKQSFKTVVEWRIREGIDKKTYQDYSDVLDIALVFCTFERDKLGHPIAYFRFPETGLDGDEWERVHKSAIFAAEKGAELSGEMGLFQTTWILDFANLGVRTAPPRKQVREMIHLWTSYYPERLHHAYIVNLPRLCQWLWGVVEMFLTENTKGKMTMLDSTASKTAEAFELIDADSLHEDYGGNWTGRYSFEYESTVRQSKLLAEQDMGLTDGEASEKEAESKMDD